MSKTNTSLCSYLNKLRPLFSRQEKLQYGGLLVLMGIGAALDFVGLGMIPAFVAALAAPEQLESLPILGPLVSGLGDRVDGVGLGPLWIGAGALLAVFVIKGFYFAWMYRIQFGLLARHRVSIAQRLFKAYMNAPWTFHLQRNSAELLRNINLETTEIVRGVVLSALGVVLGVIMTAFIAVLIAVTLPWQTWIAFGGLALVCGVLFGRLRTALTKVGSVAKQERKQSIQAVNEGLATLLDARILGKEDFLVRRFGESMGRFAKADEFRGVVQAVFPYAIETIAVAGLLLILGFLLTTGQTFTAILPQLALVGAATMRLRQTVSKIFSGLGHIHFSKVAIPHVVDDLRLLEPDAAQRASKERAAAGPLEFREKLVFESVTFTYPEAAGPALRDLSFQIKAGESVAFVGATGAGKSTLLNLLLGLLAPDQGRILVDGQPIHPHPERWQRLLGYVPQTIHLLDDTIQRNIAFGVDDDEIDEARVHEVLALAQLSETVAAMPQGLETIVGERGVRLSGGQKQRLGIARALYVQPEVLVMDEGTSALDSATEASLVECLRALEGRITMVFVAHRLTTVKHCRQICFLKEGRMAGTGRHGDLLDTLPEYRALHLVSTHPLELSVPGAGR